MPVNFGNAETMAALKSAKKICKALNGLHAAAELGLGYLLEAYPEENDIWDNDPLDWMRNVSNDTIEHLLKEVNSVVMPLGFHIVFNRLTASYELREFTIS